MAMANSYRVSRSCYFIWFLLNFFCRCSIWPSSLYLSELILSHPEHFSGKSCFEVDSGVGLVGVCLAQIKASKVILTDGHPSSLANLEINLKLNNITPHNRELDSVESTIVKCVHLSWESVTENVVQDSSPDIILGADVRYDPLCLPHLERLLAIPLCRKEPSRLWHELNHKNQETGMSRDNGVDCGVRSLSLAKHPEAYIRSVSFIGGASRSCHPPHHGNSSALGFASIHAVL